MGLLALAHSPMLASQSLETETFSYQLEDLKELKDALEATVSSEGKTVFLYDKRKVLIQDKKENFPFIKAVMIEFNPQSGASATGPMVRVELFFDEARDAARSGVRVEGGFERGPVTIRNSPGRGNRIRVDAIERNMTSSSNQMSFLMVQSGSWARLNVSREVPRPTYFRSYLTRHGWIDESIGFEWSRVGTVLEVAPRVRGNLIELELIPVVTSLVKGSAESMRIRELATRVTVASGHRVHVGGFDKADSEFNRQFLGYDRRSGSGAVSFSVRATIQ